MRKSSKRKEIARRHRRERLYNIAIITILISLTVVAFLPTIVLRMQVNAKVPEVKVEKVSEPIKQETEMDWSNFTSIYEEDILIAKAAEEEVRQKAIVGFGTELAEEIVGITANVKWFNTSAYCPCQKCCGKTDGITASQQKAMNWYTIAAGNQYEMGTIIYIPTLSHEPNGGWFIVQDRGGAISNDKLDIYFNTHEEALQYGRKTLECYVYEF